MQIKDRVLKTGTDTGKLILDWLYPHTCPFCGKVTKNPVCRVCAGKLPYVEEPLCKKCGKPIRSETAEYCFDCTRTEHSYDRGFGLWLHQQPVQRSVYQFKYHNRRIYSQYYAQEMVKRFKQAVFQWKIDLIIPIPLYKQRKKIRGYNQAEVLATQIGALLSLPVDAVSLKRIRATSPQKKLDVRTRKKNLNNAFALDKKAVLPRTVLLVDDIYTTGSTIDTAALVLKQAGVQKVYFLTISIGQGY